MFQQTGHHKSNIALVSTGMFQTFKGREPREQIYLIASKWLKQAKSDAFYFTGELVMLASQGVYSVHSTKECYYMVCTVLVLGSDMVLDWCSNT